MPGWDDLPLLPGSARSPGIEEAWQSAKIEDEADPRALDQFYAVWLDHIRVRRLHDSPEQWHERLTEYSAARGAERDSFRWRQFSGCPERRREYWAIFKAWEMTAAPGELSSVTGRWWRSYLYQIESNFSTTQQRLDYLEQAATVCLNHKQCAPTASLERRYHQIRALQRRAKAFALLNSGARLQDVESTFEEAARSWMRAADRSRGPAKESALRQVAMANWWHLSFRMLRCEQEGNTKGALEAYSQAVEEMKKAEQILGIIGYGEWLGGSADFERETELIASIQELGRGPDGLSEACLHLDCWIAQSSTSLSGTSRLKRATIRQKALHALAKKARGLNTIRDRYDIERLQGSREGLDRQTRALISLTLLALLNAAPLERTIERITRLFPIVSRMSVPGEWLTEASPSNRDPWKWLPPWYEKVLNSARAEGDPSGSRLILEHYLRTVCDYVWHDYLDALRERRYEPLPEIPSDLSIATLPDLYEAVSGLDRARGWKKVRGRALHRLKDLAFQARHAPDEEIDSSLLDDVVAETSRHLYPLPVQFRSVCDDGRLELAREDAGLEPLYATAGSYSPEPDEYFFLPPEYRFQSGSIKQNSFAGRQGKPLHFHKSSTFGRPRDVYILLEGPSDVACIEAILDHRIPGWRCLGTIHLVGDSDVLGVHRVMRAKGTLCVVLMDDDRSPEHAVDKRDRRLWPDVIWGTTIAPDLEQHNIEAYTRAISEVWDLPRSDDDLRERIALIRDLSTASHHGNMFEKTMKGAFPGRNPKAREIGKELAHQFIAFGIPEPIEVTVATALKLGFGITPPASYSPPTEPVDVS